MKKRITVIILALCTVLTSFFTPRVLTARALTTPEIDILYNGNPVSDLVISKNEKYEITARCSPENESYGYRWQICADTEASLWVDIYGANESTLKVTYPRLSSLLDDAGSVSLRCAVTLSGETFFSSLLNVTVALNATEADPPAPKEESAAEKSEEPVAAYSLKKVRAGALSDESEYVYITINYKDSTSKEAIYSPYTAKVEKGIAFEQTVISPTFLGYAPYYTDSEGIENNGLTVTLRYTNLTEDVTVDVYYKPIEVPYAVRYFFQNINDDIYIENAGLYHIGKALTGTIIDNNILEANAGDTTGFSKLYHYPENVAADGSTVFECYYDRNYYLLKFDTDGGYGVDPLYARYDTPFIVNDPVKPGYVFKGWDLLGADGTGDGVADSLPSTLPASNQRYKALWESVETTVTFVYWKENANDENYSYWGSSTENAVSGTTVSGTDNVKEKSFANTIKQEEVPQSYINGHTYSKVRAFYDYEFFHFDHADTDVMVNGDGSTVVNVYYKRNVYELRFYYSRKNGSDYYVSNATESAKIDQGWGAWVSALPTLKNGLTYSSEIINGATYYYYSLKAKFEADISDLWPSDLCETTSGYSLINWGPLDGCKYRTKIGPNASIAGTYSTMSAELIADPANTAEKGMANGLVGWWYNQAAGEQTYYIYFELLPSESDDGAVSYNGKKYKLEKSIVFTALYNGWTSFDAITFPGMRCITENYGRDYETSHVFYYDRERYNLNYYNYNDSSDTPKPKEVLYGQSVAEFEMSDMSEYYPNLLESNAYEFAGWCDDPSCSKLTDWSGTMMDHKTVYAKWVPKIHTVRFFQTYQDMLNYEQNGNESGLIETHNVSHGNAVGTVDNPTDTSEQKYTFGGWFYKENGEKIAFAPLDTPIKEEINVFADWGSLMAQPYLLHYVLKTVETEDIWKTAALAAADGSPIDQKRYEVTVDGETRGYVYYENGWHRCVADDTSGYAYQGSTRTFIAKAGEPFNQLYPDYSKNGYFPTLASHSITIEFEGNTSQPQKNVFTFPYVCATNIPYTVKYLDKNTGLALEEDFKTTTSLSIVTERFKVIENYVPDAFYKRLVISVKEDPDHPGNYIGSDNNVITFYYTKIETAAFYAVHYMLQKLGTNGESYKIDGSGDYCESDSHIEGIADKGSTVGIAPLAFDGFTAVRNPAITKINGMENEISAESDGNYKLTIDESGSELYLFYTRNTYDFTVKYLRYNTDESVKDSKTLTAQEYGSTVTETAPTIAGMSCVSPLTQSSVVRSNANQNVIIFYYSPVQYTVEYKVWDKGGGTLSSTIEVKEGTFDFEGSAATADFGYKFDGWYLDPECTVSANSKGDIDANGKLVPKTGEISPMPTVNTFYAKFTRLYGMLTINRENAEDESHGTQTFIYKIIDKNDPTNVFYATVSGNNSRTVTNVPCGDYTVEQLNGWSWRYRDNSQEIRLDAGRKTVTFGQAADKEYWLSGNAEPKINTRSGG